MDSTLNTRTTTTGATIDRDRDLNDVPTFDATMPREPRTARSESLTGLFGDLWRQTTTLVHQEAALAKAELSEKISHMALGIGGIAAGGAVIFAGFIILLSSAVNALAPYLPPAMAAWLAPLIVGLVIIIIGYIIYASGKSALDASNLKPSRTVASLQQDGQLVKEHVQ